jgi:hypothetical protein
MGMLLVTGVMQAMRTPEEQAQLDQDLVVAVESRSSYLVREKLLQGADPDISVLVYSNTVPLLTYYCEILGGKEGDEIGSLLKQ